MYARIEADIENGLIKGHDASRIPSHAHVLITLLRGAPKKMSLGEPMSLGGSLGVISIFYNCFWHCSYTVRNVASLSSLFSIYLTCAKTAL